MSKLGDSPHSFILYGIHEDTWNMLANRVIWRTKFLRFTAYKLVDNRLAFLGAIKHLSNYYSDKDSPSLRNNIILIWKQGNGVESLIHDLLLETESKMLCGDDTPVIDQASIDEIIDSLCVRFMPVAKAGGVPNPFTNLYLEKNPFNNDQWHRLKVMVSTTLYDTELHGRWEFWSAWTCSMCHGIDHPRGLCPFDNLENDVSLSEPAVPHPNETKTNKRGGRNNRGIPRGCAGGAAGKSSGR